MKIRTFTAPSLHAALGAAREALGDDVVLLESVPPEGGQLARVTVMADNPAPARPAPAPAPPAGFGYRGYTRAPQAPAPEEARPPARFAPAPPPAAEPPARTNREPRPERFEREEAPPASSPARGRLFPRQPEPAAPPARPEEAPPRLEKTLEAQLVLLHERIDGLERLLGGALVGLSQRWTAHPLFARLLEKGLRPATATRLFDAVAAQGHQPDEDPEALRWALAQELRRMLDLPVPKKSAGTIVFIGPAGVGKTTLLLKVARHPAFYGRRQAAVIYILPEEEEDVPAQNPADLFRQSGLPVQAVRTEEEMLRALDRVQHFDQILIDTPPMPMHGTEAHRGFWRLKRLLNPVVPLEVHLVMNTTRALEAFDAPFVNGLPLRPDAVALTHLDETEGWGRIAEWILQLGRPIRFASTGRQVPDGVVPFSTAWFIEEMMDL